MIKMNNKLWELCKSKSYLSDIRISQIHEYLIKSLNASLGDVVELGVLHGGTSKYLSNIANDRTIHIFDTFTGLPEYFISAMDGNMSPNFFTDTHQDIVKRYLSDCNNIKIYQGIIPIVLNRLEIDNFCFVFLDCVLYFPTYSSLLYFGKKIDKKGFMIIDDYGREETPGIKLAVDDFLSKNKNFKKLELDDYMIVIYIEE